MNGLTLVALLIVVLALLLAWRIGVASGRRAERVLDRAALRPAVGTSVTTPSTGTANAQVPVSAAMGTRIPVGVADVAAVGVADATASGPGPAGAAPPKPAGGPVVGAACATPASNTTHANGNQRHHAGSDSGLAEERARLLRSLATENATLRTRLADAAAIEEHLSTLAEDRRRLFPMLAAARGETARYRALVIDLEDNAPPPLLGGPSAPDDLKLIVGIGPVLERLLQQMGITTYRQIARWSERDVDDIDARLPEFPGRIRRDAWVTQARAIHQSKYGEVLPVRDR